WRFFAEGIALPDAEPGEVRQPVELPEQKLGTLSFQPGDETDAGEIVAEAAAWLAGVLALAMRFEQLRSLAVTDELSGAYNRRYFLKFMAGALEKAREKRTRVTLLLFDIDD